MTKAVFDLSTEGHRESYFQIFEKLWGAKRLVGPSSLAETENYDHVVFLSADDYFVNYFLRALSRSLAGKKTDGVLLRAENLVLQQGTLKRIVKGLLLRFLKTIPGVRTIGIVPFAILPDLKKYLSDTIYDLQFWDVKELHPTLALSGKAPEKFQQIKALAKGRKVVMALGRQDESKGILFFFDIWKNPEIRKNFFFVVIGKNRTVDPVAFQEFEKNDGFVWNETVSDDDLIASYRQADLIWCCYHPSYDVSSGIYGRSLQLQRANIVREGSLLSLYADRLGTSLRIKYGGVDEAAETLLRAQPQAPAINPEIFKEDFRRIFLEPEM